METKQLGSFPRFFFFFFPGSNCSRKDAYVLSSGFSSNLYLVYISNRFLGGIDAVSLGNNSSLKATGPDQLHAMPNVQMMFAYGQCMQPGGITNARHGYMDAE